MKSTDELLLCLLREIAAFGGLPEHIIDRRHDRGVMGMALVGVPYRPADWLGVPLSGSERMTLTRLVRRAERANLLIRVTERERDRVRNIVPTLAGLQHAFELAGANIDRSAVLAGLQRTQWGRDLAHQLTVDQHDLTPPAEDALQQGYSASGRIASENMTCVSL